MSLGTNGIITDMACKSNAILDGTLPEFINQVNDNSQKYKEAIAHPKEKITINHTIVPKEEVKVNATTDGFFEGPSLDDSL